MLAEDYSQRKRVTINLKTHKNWTLLALALSFLSLFLAQPDGAQQREITSCTGTACPKNSSIEASSIRASFKISKSVDFCKQDHYKEKKITLVGLCEDGFIVSTYLNESIQDFAPKIVVPKQGDSIQLYVTEHRVTYLINGSLAYTHFSVVPIELTRLSFNERSFSDYGNNFEIESFYVEKNGKSFVLVSFLTFMALLLVFYTWLLWNADSAFSEVRKFRIKGWTKVVIALIWLMSGYHLFSLSRHNLMSTLETPFLSLSYAFSDLWQIQQMSEFDKPYEMMRINYPPFALFLMKIVTEFGSLFTFGTFVLSAIIIIYYSSKVFIFSKSRFWNFVVIPFAFFPISFGFIRGNLDLIAVTLIVLGLSEFLRNSPLKSMLILTLAASIKLWPIFILLFLFWARRKMLLLAMITFIAIQNVSLNFLGYPNVFDNWTLWAGYFSESNAGSRLEAYANTSLVVLLKGMYFLKSIKVDEMWDAQLTIPTIPNLFLIQIFLLAILIGYLCINRRLEFSSKFTLIALFLLLVPNPSFLYRSILLLPVFMIRGRIEEDYQGKDSLDSASNRVESLAVAIILIGLSPGTYLFFGNERIPISVFQNSLLFLIGSGLLAYSDARSRNSFSKI